MADLSQNPEFVPGWDVYRDGDGIPVTVSPQQSRAIWHAISIVEDVRRVEGYDRMITDSASQTQANLAKSRLLGRMLFQGLPPTSSKPPVELGGPAWELLPGGDPFATGGARVP